MKGTTFEITRPIGEVIVQKGALVDDILEQKSTGKFNRVNYINGGCHHHFWKL